MQSEAVQMLPDMVLVLMYINGIRKVGVRCRETWCRDCLSCVSCLEVGFRCGMSCSLFFDTLWNIQMLLCIRVEYPNSAYFAAWVCTLQSIFMRVNASLGMTAQGLIPSSMLYLSNKWAALLRGTVCCRASAVQRSGLHRKLWHADLKIMGKGCHYNVCIMYIIMYIACQIGRSTCYCVTTEHSRQSRLETSTICDCSNDNQRDRAESYCKQGQAEKHKAMSKHRSNLWNIKHWVSIVLTYENCAQVDIRHTETWTQCWQVHT